MTGTDHRWPTRILVDAVELVMDFRGRTPKKLGLEWGEGNISAISARNVRMGSIDFDIENYQASETLYNRWMTRGDMARGDVLFTTEAPLGNVAQVPDDRRYVLSQRTILLRAKLGEFDSTFLHYVLQSPEFQRLLTDNASGSTALGIQRKRLEQLDIASPPLRAQQAIAAALHDADLQIRGLGRLIAKKRDVKQGVMQELLTGETRLTGFTGDWNGVRFGDVLTVRHGRDQKSVEVPDGRYKILATGGQIGTTNTPLYSKPSVLIGRKGTIDRPQFQDKPFWCVDTLFYTDIRDGADPKYLFYVFQTIDWRSMNEASGVPSLTSGRVEAVEVELPTLDEQRAIRIVLDDANAEIAALERRLESARAVKVGMMQELLIGRTRLPMKDEA